MSAAATVTPDDGEVAPRAGRGRSARQFWEIPKAGWRDIAVRTWQETAEDNISLLAAGVAFYSFLAFVPNAEIERQTAQDTTTGPDTPMGERGASMADTTAAGGDTPPKSAKPDAAPATDGKSGTGKPSLAAPVLAGIAASRISHHVGDVPLGVVPMTLIATGLTLISQRGFATRGMLCLAGGGLLTWRAQVRAR